MSSLVGFGMNQNDQKDLKKFQFYKAEVYSCSWKQKHGQNALIFSSLKTEI